MKKSDFMFIFSYLLSIHFYSPWWNKEGKLSIIHFAEYESVKTSFNTLMSEIWKEGFWYWFLHVLEGTLPRKLLHRNQRYCNILQSYLLRHRVVW
jgi:hypothetical protein